jgi:hypothetical protein
MITYTQDAEKGIAELTLDGSINRESFDEVVGQLVPLMEAHGVVGLLKHIVSIGGISPSVLWDDVKFAYHNLKHVGPVAVVSDKKWIEVWTKMADPFFKSEARYFTEDQLDEARAWLEEATNKARGAASSR